MGASNKSRSGALANVSSWECGTANSAGVHGVPLPWQFRGGRTEQPDHCAAIQSKPLRYLIVQPSWGTGYHNQRECLVNYVTLAHALDASLVVRLMPHSANMPRYLPSSGGPLMAAFDGENMNTLGATFDLPRLRTVVCVVPWSTSMQLLPRVVLSDTDLPPYEGLGKWDGGAWWRHAVVFDVGNVVSAPGSTWDVAWGSWTGCYSWHMSRDHASNASDGVAASPLIHRLAAAVVARIRGSAPCSPLVVLHVRAWSCHPSVDALDAPLRAMEEAGLHMPSATLYFASEVASYEPAMRLLRAKFARVFRLADFDERVLPPGDSPNPNPVPLSSSLPNCAISALNEAVGVAGDVYVGMQYGISSFDSYVQLDRVARGARGDSYVSYVAVDGSC